MLKSLLGIRFRALLSGLGGRNKKGVRTVSKGKIIFLAILYAYLSVTFAFLSGMTAALVGSMTVGTEAEGVFFSLFLLIPFVVVLFFSIFEMKAEIYEGRDNAILLSLPIPAKTVVLSRILTVLIYNFIECAVFSLPAWIVYLFLGGRFVRFLAALVMSIFTTLLATAVSSAIGYVIAWISARVKNKNIVSLLTSLLFLGLYFYFYGKLITADADLENVLASAVPSAQSSTVLRLLGTAVTTGVGFLLWGLFCLAAFALCYYLISLNFLRLVTRQKTVKMTYKTKKEEVNSPFFTLCRKEFGRFFSSSNYILNGGMGLIMGIAVTVVVLVKKGDLYNLAEMIGIEGGLYPLLLTAVLAVASSCSISYSALSLEGKSLWLIRSLPVPAKTVLLAKAAPHFLCALPANFLSALALTFAVTPNPAEWPFALLLPLVSSAAFALLGVTVNTAFPKFDFTNELEVIKQSLPMFIGTFVPFLVSAGIVGATFALSVFGLGWAGLLFAAVLYFLIALASYILLVGPCARKFNRI